MATEEGMSLCHSEVVEHMQSILAQLLSDSMLNDLPNDVSAEEVQTRLAYEQNSALKITVKKEDNTNIGKYRGCMCIHACMLHTLW